MTPVPEPRRGDAAVNEFGRAPQYGGATGPAWLAARVGWPSVALAPLRVATRPAPDAPPVT